MGASAPEARPEQRRILMMISDGAPVDDSTLSVNPGNYLERHLRAVIDLIDNPLVGRTARHWHRPRRHALFIAGPSPSSMPMELAGAMTEQLAALFGEESARDVRRERPARRRPPLRMTPAPQQPAGSPPRCFLILVLAGLPSRRRHTGGAGPGHRTHLPAGRPFPSRLGRDAFRASRIRRRLRDAVSPQDRFGQLSSMRFRHTGRGLHRRRRSRPLVRRHHRTRRRPRADRHGGIFHAEHAECGWRGLSSTSTLPTPRGLSVHERHRHGKI